MKKGILIVSCQALSNEPLHSSFIMSKMALAAKVGGAGGIRANGAEDIAAIRKEVDLPIIGLIKREYPDSEVYITPTYREVEELGKAGVEVIALDGTLRRRPKEELREIVRKCRKNFPEIKLMADIATLKEAKACEELGFDYIGTTLHGYTEETRGMDISKEDFQYLKNILREVEVPVIAEGKIDTPEKARRVMELGCCSVVVGGAITRPQQITNFFFTAIKL